MDDKIMTEDRKHVLPSPDLTSDMNARMSPSELLSLLDSFHERLDAFFEEMRSFPERPRERLASAGR